MKIKPSRIRPISNLPTMFWSGVLRFTLTVGFAVSPAFVRAELTCSGLVASVPATTLTSQKPVEQNILAVHLTNYFPADGFVRTTTANAGRFGVSLHFSLGQPVLDHQSGNWSQRKFGVVLPLHRMRDQILNLFPQDTFVLGDVKLPADAVVFVPAGEPIPARLPYKILRYDPAGGLRASIREYIKKSDTISLDAPNEKIYAKVWYEGLNLNNRNDSKTLFKELYAEKPYVTTATHEETPWGRVDYQIIDWVSAWLVSGEPLSRQETVDFYVGLLKVEDSLAEANRVASRMKLPPYSLQSWKAGLAAIQGPLNLARADFALRKDHGKSILETDFSKNKQLHEQIKAALFHPPELQKLIDLNLNLLASVSKEQGDLLVDFVHEALRYSDLSTYSQKMSESFPHPTASEVEQISYWGITKVIDLLSVGGIKAEAAVAEWSAKFPHARSKSITNLSVPSWVNQFVRSQKEPLNPELVRFFQSPPVKTKLAEAYEASREKLAKENPELLPRFDRLFGTK